MIDSLKELLLHPDIEFAKQGCLLWESLGQDKDEFKQTLAKIFNKRAVDGLMTGIVGHLLQDEVFYNTSTSRTLSIAYVKHWIFCHYASLDEEWMSKIFILCDNDGFLGEIPENISNLKNLLCLDLEYSQISVIPEEIQYLEKLQHLRLSRNHIGDVSDFIYKMPNLRVLDLRSNPILFMIRNVETDTFIINKKNLIDLAVYGGRFGSGESPPKFNLRDAQVMDRM